MYIYLNSQLDKEKRYILLNSTCSYVELNNTYWETEDDCNLKDGTCLEIIYRNINDIDSILNNILVNCYASCGYTTCIAYNIFNSQILYDPKGLYANLVQKYTMPYPEKLRENIISKNRNLLDGKIPSYSYQIEKAIKRNDYITVNHRITEFLSSYFYILFALNRTYHSGEKRLLTTSLNKFEILPKDFEKNLLNLLNIYDTKNIMETITKMISALDLIVAIENI